MGRQAKKHFEELREWSERKHRVLLRYLAPAVKILGSKCQPYYVDGFAGRGTYGEGDEKMHGSPLKAAELAQEYKEHGKNYAFKCINVESDAGNFADLEVATSRFGDIVTNLEGTFVEKTDQILKMIHGHPAIFFLDPFGVKGIDLEAIRKIINRGSPSDFWIRFDPGTARRLDGFFDLSDRSNRAQLTTLQPIYGLNDPRLLHERLSGDNPQERLHNAVELYQERLLATYKGSSSAGYVAVYPLRAIGGATKYYLIFAAANSKGAVLASDTLYHAEEAYQQEHREHTIKRTLQPMLTGIEPSSEDLFQQKVRELKEDIWELCRGTIKTRHDIHTAVLRKWFGEISGKHITEALRLLQEDGQIASRDGARSDRYTHFTFRPT